MRLGGDEDGGEVVVSFSRTACERFGFFVKFSGLEAFVQLIIRVVPGFDQ